MAEWLGALRERSAVSLLPAGVEPAASLRRASHPPDAPAVAFNYGTKDHRIRHFSETRPYSVLLADKKTELLIPWLLAWTRPAE